MKNKIILLLIVIYSCGKDSIPDPDPAVLLAPQNGNNCNTASSVSLDQSRVDFSWTKSNNTDYYEVIAINKSSNIKYKDTTSGISFKGEVSESISLKLTLPKGFAYSWSVTSFSNSTIIMTESEIWEFYLEGNVDGDFLPQPANLVYPANEDFTQQEFYKIPPTLIFNVDDSMDVMKEEIFGPVLPIKEYESLDETISYVNSNDKPLGLYYFGSDKNEEAKVIDKTSSGGVTVNNVISHIQQGDLPFGGVGGSGMGQYDGHDGFKNFSNQKSVFKDISFRLDSLFSSIRPPYKGDIEKILKSLLK